MFRLACVAAAIFLARTCTSFSACNAPRHETARCRINPRFVQSHLGAVSSLMRGTLYVPKNRTGTQNRHNGGFCGQRTMRDECGIVLLLVPLKILAGEIGRISLPQATGAGVLTRISKKAVGCGFIFGSDRLSRGCTPNPGSLR